ncbi:hypothetical protein KVF89_04060 [Nocardioides carbamazepini]|uniref:hypothetical protein n=1 Tax=Nocardioides carbamazepini TaxID=2854259 RepID=UPI00214A5DA8|nr:hypothetical protein [Nocardioides carbamazepini]MCR1781700.1 hypothetical protein [Nocardioides carbamazepini]
MEGFEQLSVFYPRGVRTGGPEALHQLVDALRSLGHDAALVAMPGTEGRPRVADYDHYDAPEREAARCGPRDAVVTPEVWVPRAAVVGSATWFCWWLSVDNSPVFMDARRRHNGLLLSRTPAAALRALPRATARRLLGPARRRRLGAAVHLAQSVYAREFVARELGTSVGLLSDYVTATPADREGLVADGDVPVVSFNPAKGGEAVAKVSELLTTPVRWLPIAGMSPSEVEDALRRSDVYLDLGSLPGKDRIPREAALHGAVTLLAARGAGANTQDFPLPDEHRIPLEPDLVRNTVGTLQQVLADLPGHARRQRAFRSHLATERRRFADEVRTVFGSPGSSL